MTTPPIPPPPRPQTFLSFHAGQHNVRRVESNAAEVAARVARGQRRAHLVELVEQLPETAPMHMPAQVPPTNAADVELCLHCGHSRMTHTRGRDTPIACTTPRCGCRGFDDGGLPVAAVLWALLGTVLAVAAVVLGVFAAFGVAFLIGAVAVMAAALAWIYSAPDTPGGGR